jgi:hypothetical protein
LDSSTKEKITISKVNIIKNEFLCLILFFVFRLTEKPGNSSSCYTYPTLPIREFHDLNAPIASAIDDREYAIPDVNFYTIFSQKYNLYSPRLMRASTTNSENINLCPTLNSIPHCCIYQQQQQQYITMCQQPSMLISPIQEGLPVEGICGNSLMITMNMMVENQQMLIKEIDGDNLVFVKKIGDGSFGSIHLAELKVINNNNNIEKQHVIVKSLNDNVGDNQK